MIRKISLVILHVTLIAGCHRPADSPNTAPASAAEIRPLEWAQPIGLPGCPNLHRVTDTLYRGAQPTAEGFGQLEFMGIETVVNLRSFHSDKDEIGGRNLRVIDIPMKAWHPEDEDVVRFLKAVTDRGNGMVFVHCQQGADRTGVMMAIYRVAVQGWTKEAAVREMRDGGYGFHGVWQDLVNYVNGLDVERIRKEAGLTK